MNAKKTFVCFFLLVLSFVASVAEAQLPTLTYTSQLRLVNYRRDIFDLVDGSRLSNPIDETIRNASLGIFDIELQGEDLPFRPGLNLNPAATQTTSFNFNSIVGSGSFDTLEAEGVSQDIALDSGNSLFFTTFDLSAPTDFSLDVSVTGGATFRLGLIGSPEFIFFGFNEDINQSGILAAGEYELSIDDGATSPLVGYDRSGTFDIDFQVNVVPEPSSLIWMLAAALGVATKRRRTS